MSPSRPLLLLDVDGVLNAFDAWVAQTGVLGRRTLRPPRGMRHAEVDGYQLLLVPEHVAWLRELEGRAEIVWATMWQQRAPQALAPVLGIGADWAWLDFAAAQGYAFGRRTGEGVGSYKFPAVVQAAGERPTVWIDDDLEPAIYEWAAERDASGTPTLLVQPSPREGWTASECQAVLAFLDRVEGSGVSDASAGGEPHVRQHGRG